MNNKNLPPTLAIITLIVCVAGFLPLHAQNLLLNGDLEGPTGLSTLPPHWQNVPHTSGNSSAQDEHHATVDTLSNIDPIPGSGLANTPHSGSTFVSGLHTHIHREGIQQQVRLKEGVEYEIIFWESVIVQEFEMGNSGTWLVFIEDTLISSRDDYTTSGEAHESLNHPWAKRTLRFTAQGDGVRTLAFVPHDEDANPDVRMAIDGISMIQIEPNSVPEPSSLSLLALGSAALLARRKR